VGGKMTIVNNESREAMKRILNALNDEPKALAPTKKEIMEANDPLNDLGSPGQPSNQAIDAMAQVMNRLNNVTSQVLTEGKFDPQLNEAINTKRVDNNIKVGNYQITIKEDEQRIAGKQFYSIYHSQSGDVIADDITLYETALTIIKLLNNGKYVNSSIVRKLFDADDRYTAHRSDAIRFKSRAKTSEKNKDFNKSQIYESRYQASVSNAMFAKKNIKELIIESKKL
jgi:hypothetical protein